MYLDFAWRYFKAKKSANAINIISWITTGVIAFATCCQILVLSVYNGFEDLVKSLYSSFYSEMKIIPATGKTITLDSALIYKINQNPFVETVSYNIEEKALLKNGDFQSIVKIKGVDAQYKNLVNISEKIIQGKFQLGNIDTPKIVVGYGVQQAAGIMLNEAFGPENLTIILPKSNAVNSDPLSNLSEGVIQASGVFSIQQEFDNSYALTNIDFLRQQTGMPENTFSAVEIRLKKNIDNKKAFEYFKNITGNKMIVQNRFEQNASLYQTMAIEKWAIYAVLTLILIIAAFNMISALTMLVLEKKQDISILQSMGASSTQIRKIFLSEGFLLGIIGTSIGVGSAILICLLQLKFKIIKIQGGSFLIDYFPVKMLLTDFLMVIGVAFIIVFIASWLPANKASKQPLSLK
jgi:lipoprotein-releasing system permease protein